MSHPWKSRAQQAMAARPTKRQIRQAIDMQAPLDHEPVAAVRKKPRRWVEDDVPDLEAVEDGAELVHAPANKRGDVETT